MLNVLALSFYDGLSICWRKRVTCDRGVVLHMCDWLHENLLSFRQTEDDSVILREYDGGLLTVHETGSLIVLLREYHAHVPVREDGLRVRYTGTGDVGQRASLK